MTGVKKNFLKLTLDKSHFITGSYAFSRCSGFTGNLVIPEGVTSIGDSAFEDCRGFTGNLVIPEGVTSIGYDAFYKCRGFTGNLLIPEGVTSIGDDAFSFSGFKCVIIPRKIGLEYEIDDLFCCNSGSSIECIYYGGTKVEWQQKNSDLNEKIIVFCSDGILQEGAVSEQENPKSVKYFDRWDSENQIAYFGKNDFLGSRVTDETDTSFLENVENMVGKYVLVETKERTDDLVDANTLISITEVETKKGKVVSVDAGTLTIGDKKYEVADTSLLWLIRPDDTIVYHIQNEKIVGITTLRKETGILKGYNSETKEVTITSESLTVYTYVLSDLADEETLELLGISGSKNISVNYVVDSDGIMIYDITEKLEEDNDNEDPFDPKKDGNTFNHSDLAFGYYVNDNGEPVKCVQYGENHVGEVYPTSSIYYNRLIEGMKKPERDELWDMMNKGTWKGSCLGLQLSILWTYTKDADISEFEKSDSEIYYPNSISSYSKLKSPNIDIDLRNYINYCHLLQYTDKLPITKIKKSHSAKNWESFMKKLLI